MQPTSYYLTPPGTARTMLSPDSAGTEPPLSVEAVMAMLERLFCVMLAEISASDAVSRFICLLSPTGRCALLIRVNTRLLFVCVAVAVAWERWGGTSGNGVGGDFLPLLRALEAQTTPPSLYCSDPSSGAHVPSPSCRDREEAKRVFSCKPLDARARQARHALRGCSLHHPSPGSLPHF